MNQHLHGTSRTTAIALSITLCTSMAFAHLDYVDATTGNQVGAPGNTTYADGSPFTPSTSGSAALADNTWHERTGFANSGNILASNADSDAPALRTTIHGLDHGAICEVFAYYWVAGDGAPTGNEEWDIAFGLSEASLQPYLWNDGTEVPPSLHFNNPVIITEGSRRLFQIFLGTVSVDVSGSIDVYVDDNPGNDDRTWYDGVGVIVHPIGTTYCWGDGTGTPCPCGNNGGAREGCANSTGEGAMLNGSGSASVSAANLILAGSQLDPNQPGLYFQGNNAVNSGLGNPFGDGLRCAGGGVVRLQVRVANSSGNSATTADIANRGGVAPGDTKYYQLWYRNPGGSPCSSNFNLSNGYVITWQL